jgi:hypothetical protein
VLVPGGTNTATFSVTTKLVAKPTAVMLSASLAGQSKSQTLTVLPKT